jgi:hypothetical protein
LYAKCIAKNGLSHMSLGFDQAKTTTELCEKDITDVVSKLPQWTSSPNGVCFNRMDCTFKMNSYSLLVVVAHGGAGV